jgi:3-hydroxyacyl-CoA dehydrogenase
MTNTAATIAVVGGGRMGTGIAQVFAAAGHHVVIAERDAPTASAALDSLRLGLRRAAERSALDGDVETVAGRVRTVDDLAALPADTAMELGYRHPMGPLRSTDLVGLDIRLAIAEHLGKTLSERFTPPALLREKVARGELGRKSGRGFYDWP